MKLKMKENIKWTEFCRVCAKNGTELVRIGHTKYKGKTMANILSCLLQKKIYDDDGMFELQFETSYENSYR